MLGKLFKELTVQSTIVTPNRRLANYLTTEYDNFQKNSGKKAWPSIDFLPLGSWIEKIWQSCPSNKILLSDHQERFIWQKIIANSDVRESLLNITETAKQAQQAYQLLQQWCVTLNHKTFSLSEETSTFKSWAQQFVDLCTANKWISQSNIIDELSCYHEIKFPERLILASFDQIYPQFERLLNKIIAKKCEVEYFDTNNTNSKQVRIPLQNQQQELINMALWSKQCHETNPKATIGCIVPELTAIRNQIEYIFSKINNGNFDISMGQKLSDYPLIYHVLKKLQAMEFSSEPKFPGRWAEYFIKQLQQHNWPSTDLNNCEYQLVERWQRLLEEFSSLDLVTDKFVFQDAFDQLRDLAENIIFQPKSQNTNIKILGMLEAAGLNFDHLWIMGLSDQNWPQIPHPNPFIPIQLQRKLNMPHANADRELQYCCTLTERFARSAANIIYSYPQEEKDQYFSVSPLIKNIAEISVNEFNLPEFKSFFQHNEFPVQLEYIHDEHAPSLSHSENISGGSRIFKLQAACPFRAFAEYRLGACELELPQVGFSPQERGLLVHDVLKKVWSKIGNHQQLCSYTETELLTLLQQRIDECLAKTSTDKSQFAKLEKRRLEKLLLEWLALEKDRAPFTILTQEQCLTTNLGEKQIALRVDRIDRLDDGTVLILDYKTNKTSITGWFGNRPDEPQLPLYCISIDKPVTGLIVAQVKSGELRFKGTIQQKNQVPDVKVIQDWQQQVAKWREILNQLGNDFCAGIARIDPKNGKETCRNCGLHTLCRVKDYG
ncbi:MAG: hypothetical protein AMJ43_05945 [Coxiella sp. DG_40]|nr:MAG: hypothetical protein AMJ43_05945 [Coxiella sp. DG_40]